MSIICKIFKGHKWVIKECSNVIQYDSMGYPLRLCICECSRCHKSDQQWIDSNECKSDVILKWSDN